MSNLNDAIDALKEAVLSQGATEGLLENIASEWNVNPSLLSRMFIRSCGCPWNRYEFARNHTRHTEGPNSVIGMTFLYKNQELSVLRRTPKGLLCKQKYGAFLEFEGTDDEIESLIRSIKKASFHKFKKDINKELTRKSR